MKHGGPSVQPTGVSVRTRIPCSTWYTDNCYEDNAPTCINDEWYSGAAIAQSMYGTGPVHYTEISCIRIESKLTSCQRSAGS